MRTRLLILTLFLASVASVAQTGQCHLSPHGACTSDSACTGTGNYCHVLKHIIFIIKENRSFDSYFGRFPGITGGPIGTAANPYRCTTSSGHGCSGGFAPAYAGNPTVGDGALGHDHTTALLQYHNGAMDNFNEVAADWNVGYGTACSDWATSQQLCASNSDCISGLCNQNTLPTYWSYVKNYGLADHMFSSMLGPTYPNHLYLWTASGFEAQGDPATTNWSCDSTHTGSGTTPGNGYFNTGTSCSKNTDISFTITSISGNGTTATATCYPNCGSMPASPQVAFATIAGNSNSAFNGTFTIASVPTSSTFTIASGTAGSGTGGTLTYDYCTNGNVYSATAGNGADLNVLGGTGNTYEPGVCVTNSALACMCLNWPSSACTDISGTCIGSSANCDPTHQLSSARGSACPNITTIADLLDAAGVSWKFYNEGSTVVNAASYIGHIRWGPDWTNNVNLTTGQFETDAAACTSDSSCTAFKSVIWANTFSTYPEWSEHTPGTVEQGQAWTASKINAVMNNSYLWKHSVIFIYHDDWGGFEDHLLPTQDAYHNTNGFRVPLMCVGAYCTNAVNHTNFTFESMLKCLEVQYSLPSINSRDGNANDICTTAGGMVNLALSNAPLGAGGPPQPSRRSRRGIHRRSANP